jgi:serine/threonine protein kinase
MRMRHRSRACGMMALTVGGRGGDDGGEFVSDLKPANFLFCAGVLKLIDFGIAKAISNDTTNIVRDSQVGTVNYMSPEAILNGQIGANGRPIKIGRQSDIWSLGCILYQMVYGQTPFHHIKGLVQKLHAITDPRNVIHFPDTPKVDKPVLDTIRKCLERDPARRATIPQLLNHPFLRPSAAASPPPAAAPANGLTQEALQSLLRQLPMMSGAGMHPRAFPLHNSFIPRCVLSQRDAESVTLSLSCRVDQSSRRRSVRPGSRPTSVHRCCCRRRSGGGAYVSRGVPPALFWSRAQPLAVLPQAVPRPFCPASPTRPASPTTAASSAGIPSCVCALHLLLCHRLVLVDAKPTTQSHEQCR